MKALKILGAAIAAVILIVALLLVIGIPSGFLTAEIQERVERETGYKLAINGGAKVSLWPALSVTLKDVTLQDPKDVEVNHRFTAASIEADVTLASLWAGKPRITDLAIIRPVINLPLRRERVAVPAAPSRPASGNAADKLSIEHVNVSGGTIVFYNLRDRVENRIESLNADIAIDADRKINLNGSARRNGTALKFAIKAAPPPPLIDRQTIPAEIKIDAPGLLQAQLSAKGEVRLNGPVVMVNGVTGMFGDGAFNGWASFDLSTKPLVKLDLDFQKLAVATSRSIDNTPAQPWSNATIDTTALNYIDVQARISAAELTVGTARFAPAAIEATLASSVLKAQVANLGAYQGTANGDVTIDVSTANPTYVMRADLSGVRALPLLQGLADFDRIDGKMQAKVNVRSSGTSERAIMSNLAGTAFVVFQDGAIRGLNVAQMIRSLTASTLSGWQESDEKATDLSQLSASFRIEKGQAQTTDLNLVGPLVKMSGVGTIALDTKQIGFRVEPKLVMTTEGQGRARRSGRFRHPRHDRGTVGRAADLSGNAGHPRQSRRRLRQAEGDGQRVFGEKGAGIGRPIGSLLGGQSGAGGQGAPARPAAGDRSAANSAEPLAICFSRD